MGLFSKVIGPGGKHHSLSSEEFAELHRHDGFEEPAKKNASNQSGGSISLSTSVEPAEKNASNVSGGSLDVTDEASKPF